MSTDELRDQFLLLRQARRTPQKAKVSKKGTAARRTTNQNLADWLEKIDDPAMLEKLLERMGETL